MRAVIRLLLLLALCGTGALAQTLTKPPTLLKQVEPDTGDAGVLTGTVIMEVDVGLDGKVLEVKVVNGLSPALDAAAVAAIRQFEFTPAELDHQPAAVRIQYALTFEAPVEATAIDAGTAGAGDAAAASLRAAPPRSSAPRLLIGAPPVIVR